MFKPKLPQQEQGFTLVEVLVAILITTFFVGTAMQSVVIAAVFKARARQLAEATIWIQEDLEKVKYAAAKFQYTSLTTTANAGQGSINVASVDGFVVNNTLKVGSDLGTYTISGISGTTLNITPNLGTAQLQGAEVVATTRCKSSMLTTAANAAQGSINVASVNSFAINDTLKIGSDPGTYTISVISGMSLNITPNLGTAQLEGSVVLGTVTSDTGFADGLRDNIIGSDQAGTTDIINEFTQTSSTGNVFTLKRTMALSSTAPYNRLQLTYDVIPTSGVSSVAKLYIEVIPDAALRCS